MREDATKATGTFQQEGARTTLCRRCRMLIPVKFGMLTIALVMLRLIYLSSEHIGRVGFPPLSVLLEQRQPSTVLYYLFLTCDDLPQERVWEEYLREPYRGGRVRVRVHGDKGVRLKHAMFRDNVVRHVRTGWCDEGLVTAMNVLLESALADVRDSNPSDMFIFVSGDSIPLKPFEEAHDRNMRLGSSFCFFKRDGWARCDSKVLVKTHQWLTLNRTDAERALVVDQREGKVDAWGILRKPRKPPKCSNDNCPTCKGGNGCPDEYWHYLALHGPLKPGVKEVKQIPQLARQRSRCIMFAYWGSDQAPQDGIRMEGAHTDGRDIYHAHMNTLRDLTAHENFTLARKFSSGPIIRHDNGVNISVYQALKELGVI